MMDATSWVSITAYFPPAGPAAVFETLSDVASCTANAGEGPCMEFTSAVDNIMQSSTYTGSDLDFFVGSGDLGDITLGMFEALSNFNSENIDGAEVFIWSEFDGVVSIEYEYDVAAVPLPAAFWLFGSALVGFGVIGKSKRQIT